VRTVSDVLALQDPGTEDETPETPADTYRSGNSAYACVIRSLLSIVC
jgi:hypothetical protein